VIAEGFYASGRKIGRAKNLRNARENWGKNGLQTGRYPADGSSSAAAHGAGSSSAATHGAGPSSGIAQAILPEPEPPPDSREEGVCSEAAEGTEMETEELCPRPEDDGVCFCGDAEDPPEDLFAKAMDLHEEGNSCLALEYLAKCVEKWVKERHKLNWNNIICSYYNMALMHASLGAFIPAINCCSAAMEFDMPHVRSIFNLRDVCCLLEDVVLACEIEDEHYNHDAVKHAETLAKEAGKSRELTLTDTGAMCLEDQDDETEGHSTQETLRVERQASSSVSVTGQSNSVSVTGQSNNTKPLYHPLYQNTSVSETGQSSKRAHSQCHSVSAKKQKKTKQRMHKIQQKEVLKNLLIRPRLPNGTLYKSYKKTMSMSDVLQRMLHLIPAMKKRPELMVLGRQNAAKVLQRNKKEMQELLKCAEETSKKKRKTPKEDSGDESDEREGPKKRAKRIIPRKPLLPNSDKVSDMFDIANKEPMPLKALEMVTHFDTGWLGTRQSSVHSSARGSRVRQTEPTPCVTARAKMTYEERLDALLPSHVCAVCDAMKSQEDMRKQKKLTLMMNISSCCARNPTHNRH